MNINTSSARPRTVALFVTCLVDMIYPEVGEAVVELLEGQGLTVEFPEGQTCCGQPAYNAGFREDARAMARHFLEVFGPSQADAIVCPSGSCTVMIKHYPELFEDYPAEQAEARRLAAKTYEFSQFMVDVLGVADVGAHFTGKITYHDSCHMLRGLNGARQPRTLLRQVAGANLVELPGSDECCGFGGLFAVKNAGISSAMLARKLSSIEVTKADLVVTCDASCLMQISGGLSRQKSDCQGTHLALLLANRVKKGPG